MPFLYILLPSVILIFMFQHSTSTSRAAWAAKPCTRWICWTETKSFNDSANARAGIQVCCSSHMLPTEAVKSPVLSKSLLQSHTPALQQICPLCVLWSCNSTKLKSARLPCHLLLLPPWLLSVSFLTHTYVSAAQTQGDAAEYQRTTGGCWCGRKKRRAVCVCFCQCIFRCRTQKIVCNTASKKKCLWSLKLS